MEINLLPRIPYFIRRFWFLVFIIFLLFILSGLLLYQYYLHKGVTIEELKAEVVQLENEKSILEENEKWNLNITEQIQRYREILLYNAITDLLDTRFGQYWSPVIQLVQNTLPANGQVLQLDASGNQLTGVLKLTSIDDAAIFMERLQQREDIKEVYISTIDQTTTNELFMTLPLDISPAGMSTEDTKYVEFTLVINNRFFLLDVNEGGGS